MANLFEQTQRADFRPLAVRMRPRTLDEIYGQEAVVGSQSFLAAMIRSDTVPSLLLFGPPGTGKTTIARVIANLTQSEFVTVNATTSGVAELRKVIAEAKEQGSLYGRRTIVFIDEIHRFNKGQQDLLLSYVEDGTITLIGATTENPFFEVQKALLSRLRLIRLEALTPAAIVRILQNAVTDAERGLGKQKLTVATEVLRELALQANGDARLALNMLEQTAAGLAPDTEMTLAEVERAAGTGRLAYDKSGDSHYDIASAFIKSMRGSDADAALHYLARMIEGGEKPSFMARRIMICAAEDVGLADPQALVVAQAAAQAAEMVGFPEARIILAEAVLYVALAPKSNSVITAIDAALSRVRQGATGNVPAHLRDAHYSGAQQLGHGQTYRYAHQYPNGWVRQQYLPDPLVNDQYYQPKMYGSEAELVRRWNERRGLSAIKEKQSAQSKS